MKYVIQDTVVSGYYVYSLVFTTDKLYDAKLFKSKRGAKTFMVTSSWCGMDYKIINITEKELFKARLAKL